MNVIALTLSVSLALMPMVSQALNGYGLPGKGEERPALVIKKKGKVFGVVTKMTFADPMQRQMYDLAVIEVQAGTGRTMLIKINTDTHIRDLKLTKGYIRLIEEGKRVKVEYVVTKGGDVIATSVVVHEKAPEISPKRSSKDVIR